MKKVNFGFLRILFVILLGTSNLTSVLGQKYEIGGGMGGAVYSGDIIRKIDPYQSGPLGTLFGKRNFDNVWSLRFGLSTAILQGDDEIKRIDPVLKNRDAKFKGGVIEFSAVMEFNFLDS